MDESLRSQVDRYFARKIEEVPPISFDEVYHRPKVMARRHGWQMVLATGALAAGLAWLVIPTPEDQSGSEWSDEFLSETSWKAPTDAYLHYPNIEFYYQLPELNEETDYVL